MLPWLHKSTRKRLIFWGKLFIFSLSTHVVGLVFIFFVYRGENFSYNVSINRSITKFGAPIILLPLAKTTGTNLNKLINVNKQITKNVKTKSKKVLSKKNIKPKKTTTISKTKKKKTVSKRSKKNKVSKKESTKKKIEQKKNKKKKVVKKNKKQNKNPVKKKSKIEKSKKVVQPGKIVKKKVVASKKAVVPAVAKPVEPQPIYVGRQELAALQMQAEIEQEVLKHWSPPAGLSKELTCSIKVLVGWDGNIKNSVIQKTSGVLIYDISARTAVSKLNMPKGARGKEINILFNQ